MTGMLAADVAALHRLAADLGTAADTMAGLETAPAFGKVTAGLPGTAIAAVGAGAPARTTAAFNAVAGQATDLAAALRRIQPR